MLDHLNTWAVGLLVGAGMIFAVWTFLLCKLIFLGKPRNVSLKLMGFEISVVAPECRHCGINVTQEET